MVAFNARKQQLLAAAKSKFELAQANFKQQVKLQEEFINHKNMLARLKVAQDRLEAERIERQRVWKSQMVTMEAKRQAELAATERLERESQLKAKAALDAFNLRISIQQRQQEEMRRKQRAAKLAEMERLRREQAEKDRLSKLQLEFAQKIEAEKNRAAEIEQQTRAQMMKIEMAKRMELEKLELSQAETL